jgi:hypothetical protein
MFFSMFTRGFHPLNPCRSLRRWFPDDDQRRQQEQRRAQEVTAPAERQVTILDGEIIRILGLF